MKTKKLSLNKETIVNLSNSEMIKLAGGGSMANPGTCTTCPGPDSWNCKPATTNGGPCGGGGGGVGPDASKQIMNCITAY